MMRSDEYSEFSVYQGDLDSRKFLVLGLASIRQFN